MRWTRPIFVVVAQLASVLAAAHAGAGPLQSAELRLAPAKLSPLVFPASGAGGAAVDGQTVTLQGGTAFAGAATAPLPSIFYTGLRVEVASHQAASFAGIPLAGTATFQGALGLLASGFTWVSFPIAFGAPLDVTAMGMAATGGSPVTIAIHAGGFTTGTVGTPPVTAMGSNGLGSDFGGTVRLVAPLLIQSADLGDLPMPVTLELVFAPTPEPAALLLLGVGGAVFGVAARARRR